MKVSWILRDLVLQFNSQPLNTPIVNDAFDITPPISRFNDFLFELFANEI